jgi:truncated hemoglobin YjbI
MDTLYERLGKNAGIAALVDAVFVEELKDPDIASYDVYNLGKTPGHPDLAHIKACFVLFIGEAAGGPETYPGPVEGGFTCRSMKGAHANTHIPAGIFQKFGAIGVAAVKARGVSSADIETLTTALLGTAGDVIDPSAKNGPFNPDAGGADGGG